VSSRSGQERKPIGAANGKREGDGNLVKGTTVVANSGGTAAGETGYLPWGEARYLTDTLHTDYLFTGQREESTMEDLTGFM